MEISLRLIIMYIHDTYYTIHYNTNTLLSYNVLYYYIKGISWPVYQSLDGFQVMRFKTPNNEVFNYIINYFIILLLL